jgi:LysM repeat protein
MELIRVDYAPPVMPVAPTPSQAPESANADGFAQALAAQMSPSAPTEAPELYGPPTTPSLAELLPPAPRPVPMSAAPAPTLEVTTHAANETTPFPATPAELPAMEAAPTLAPPASLRAPVNSPVMAPMTAPVQAATQPSNTYTVQAGDSLSKIARKLGGDTRQWKSLYAANKSVIGKNPDMILPGQVLHLPTGMVAKASAVAHKAPAVVAQVQVPTPPSLPEMPVMPEAAPVAVAPPAPVAPVEAAAPVAPAATVIPAPAPIAAPAAPMAAVAPEARLADAGLEPAPPVAATPAAPATSPTLFSSSLPAEAQQAVSTIDRLADQAPKTSAALDLANGPGLTHAQNLFAMREALKSVPAASPEYMRSEAKIAAYETALLNAVRPASTADAGTGPRTP